MTDEYAGDDLSGLSEELAERYRELRSEDGGPVPPTVSALDEEWSVRRIVGTMLPLLAALSVLQMVSGGVLERFESVLVQNPSLLVLVPVQIGAAGNLGSITCARLSTQLYLGTGELSASDPDVRATVVAVLGLGATVFSIVGVAAWAIGRTLGGTLALSRVVTIALGSGIALSVFVVVLSLYAVGTAYRLGFNPDDTTIPVVTNVCDVTGVLFLFGVVWVVL